MFTRSTLRLVLAIASFSYGFAIGFDVLRMLVFSLIAGLSMEAVLQLSVPVLRFRRLRMMSRPQ